MPFTKFGLSAEILRGLRDMGYKSPTSIQAEAIPPALEGRDLLACAMTGSGKTAAFVLPILQRLTTGEPRPRGTRALVLTPTRELAAQVDEQVNALGAHTAVSSASIYGGVGMGPQEHALRHGVEVIVATPGRLLDHLRYPYARFGGVEIVVLDEADRMLDMGFLPDVKRILKYLPPKRQTLLFSATLPRQVQELAREMMRDPYTINAERNAKPAVGITQAAYPVPGHLKSSLLVRLIERGEIQSVIVFTRTKHRADRLATFLSQKGISAGRIHGDRTQSQRMQTLARFKDGKLQVLVATDIAARGIDVQSLSHVINFDVPKTADDYIHRIGRTGRNEAQGDAFMFFSREEEGDLRSIERVLGKPLPRILLPDFDYKAEAPKAAPGAGRQDRPERSSFRGGRSQDGRRDRRADGRTEGSARPEASRPNPARGGGGRQNDRPGPRPDWQGDRPWARTEGGGSGAIWRKAGSGSSAGTGTAREVGGKVNGNKRFGGFRKPNRGR